MAIKAMAARVLAARVLAAALVLSVFALPAMGLSLEAQGFKAPTDDSAFAYRGMDASGTPVQGPEGRPTVVYLLHPSQASARAVLASLERFRAVNGNKIAVVALSPAGRDALAGILKDLRLGFPVLSSAILAGELRAGSTPIFLVLAPDGKPVGVRSGSVDWSGSGASSLASQILAAYPPAGGSQGAAGAPAPAGAAPAAAS
ncbi:MAG: hypothetical protein Q8M76_19270, partial [Spirochaetaceae bacterium]|nr:hypothetical protein [Spirochaetaceae bacterium]